MHSLRKAQAAMEFLMTYGWAILVVLVVIGALAYFGVLSPATLLPEKCTFPVQFGCADFEVGSNGVRLILQNGGGKDIKITSIDFSSDALKGTCGTGTLNTVVKNGEKATFYANDPLNCEFKETGRSKNRYSSEVTYSFRDSAIPHAIGGEMFARKGAGTISGEPGDSGGGSSDLSLVGYWNFEEGSGTSASDLSSYGNTGTLTGFDCTTLDCNSDSGWVSGGKVGRALAFDGVNDYVNVVSSASLNPTGELTLEAWVKKSSTKAQDIIFNDVHELKIDSSNKVVFKLMTGARKGTDMNMEAVGVTNWGSFNAPATKAKSTTNPIGGARDLHVVASSSGNHDGVYQSMISQDTTYRVKVSYKVVSGSLNIHLGNSPQANMGQGNVGLGLTGTGTVVAYVQTTGGAWGLIMTSTNSGEFYVDDIEVKQVGLSITSSGTVSTSFNHIAATYDGSATKIYINGVLDNSVAQSTALSTDSLATLIGTGAVGSSGYGQDFFDGLIDEARIYNRALSPQEVSALG